MTIKKILFETLQRFDLKDAIELQQGVLDKLDGLANASNWQASQALKAGGPLSVITSPGVSDGIVRFSPMVLLTAENDILVFNAQDQDDALLQCDISATHADWINSPQTSAIYIYAYPNYQETDTENREFFSLVDNAPTSRSINTRRSSSITFFSNLDATYNIADANGNMPIRIGYVDAADISTTNTTSPFNPQRFKSRGYFDGTINIPDYDDADLPNVANNRDDAVGGYPAGRTEGLGFYTPFKKIEKQLARICSYGTSDSQAATLLTNNNRPPYSLAGLKYLIDEATTRTNQNANKIRHTTGLIVLSHNGSNASVSLSTAYDDMNEVPLELYFDYKVLDDTNPGVVVPAKNVLNATSGYSAGERRAIFRHINARFGGANAVNYENWIIRDISVTPISQGDYPYGDLYGGANSFDNSQAPKPRIHFDWYQRPGDGFEEGGVSSISAFTRDSVNRLSTVRAMGSDGVPFNSIATARISIANPDYLNVGSGVTWVLGFSIRFTLEDPDYNT